IAVCAGGKVVDLTALDVGARLVCLDDAGRVVRVEEAGERFGAALGLELAPGRHLDPAAARALAARMADDLFAAMRGAAPAADGRSLLRLEALAWRAPIDVVTFSGGVAEYIYGRETGAFGDLGPLLAAALRARVESWGPRIEPPDEGIRATAIGAAQYATQISGSTIFVSPLDVLPLRNVPVIAPDLALAETVDPAAVASAVGAALKHLDLAQADGPVAVFVPWRGSATFARLDALCRGVAAGLSPVLARGHPLVLAGDGDVGGLLGIHCRDELKLLSPIVSIDGLELQQFDYIDIGALLQNSGAVPVVIKSLIFPGAAPRPLPGRSAARSGALQTRGP
ncbi:MAG TPA: ethanolamine ammonia-lyase reactivating factor EutA, partial [Xanthobacteraceae bacterium]|nr:ethanolamine ammonia-lyase reactivating factor EutA [Xanthobacteraceae bacterium]